MCTVVGIRPLRRKKKKVKKVVEFDLEESSEDSGEGKSKQQYFKPDRVNEWLHFEK